MSFSSADLNAIERAIAAGELDVTAASGERVRYRSIDELIRARDLIRGQLAQSGTIPARTTVSYASRSRD